jgi:hypothetical protein
MAKAMALRPGSTAPNVAPPRAPQCQGGLSGKEPKDFATDDRARIAGRLIVAAASELGTILPSSQSRTLSASPAAAGILSRLLDAACYKKVPDLGSSARVARESDRGPQRGQVAG